MRLDLYVAEQLGCTRTRASNIIKTGGVAVNGRCVEKAGQDVSDADVVEISDTVKFASLGGVKLENALRYFGLTVDGKKCLDVGAANGGFTHCMLVNGAESVAAVDVSIAFPAELLSDPRVHAFDGVNVKDIADIFPNVTFDFIAVDLSFISLVGVFPLLYPLLGAAGRLVVLFKPQYEVGKRALPKSGIVHSEKDISRALDRVIKSAEECGFFFLDRCYVPDFFSNKNKEMTLLFRK